MAVNHADGMTFAGVLVCPILVVVNLIGAGAGWLTFPCVVAVSPVCFAILYLGRKLAYLITGVGLHFVQPMKSWLQRILMAPFFFLYFALPICGIVVAVFASTYAATYLADFASHLGGWTGFAMASMAAVISASGIVACCKSWLRYAAKQSGASTAQQ